ncbi:hypothetical protein ElyMa_002652100 [Elysia marginata]|uniref:Uncharacterized protein n=1 Tax=Elysia marginata TaxID=1093978 RepID=A0AAV4HAN7_9GAST|nr:hypothetical protein ElyMa_002652100 [Elysia marginata]
MKRKLKYGGHMRGSSAPLLQLSLEGNIGMEERTEMAKKELDGRCKGMIRVDRLWRYETEGREQRRMERHGCQPSDRRRIIISRFNFCPTDST